MNGISISEIVAQAESSPAVAEARANVKRLQAEMTTAKDALGSALRGIQIAKQKVAGTLVTGGSFDVLSLEEAVEKEKVAHLRVGATEEALSTAWTHLREAKKEARRDVVPELARRQAESIEKLAKAIDTARDAELEMRETEAAANTVLDGRQSLIRVFTPAWISLFYHDGHHEVDRAADFRKKATREIEIMFAGLEKKHGVESAKLERVKPAKPGRLERLKKVFVP